MLNRKSSSIISALCVVSGIILLLTACNINQGPPPDLNKTGWLILGPFGNPISKDSFSGCPGFDYDFLSSIGGEADVRPVIGKVVIDNSPVNREWNKKNKIIRKWTPELLNNNRFDFKKYFQQNEQAAAYAYCEFYSSVNETVVLNMGSDDGIKAWLNGRLVLRHHIHRPLNSDDENLPVSIIKGTNRLLLKIDQGDGGWEFYAKLESLELSKRIWDENIRHSLDIIINKNQQSNEILCLVTSKPGYKLREKLKITIEDLNKNTFIETNGSIGCGIPVKLPESYSGVYLIKAVSLNGSAVKAENLFYTGDIRIIKEDAVKKAREMALNIQPAAQPPDIAATCTFLADQLEGKLHPNLSTLQRNLQALRDIYQLKNNISNNELHAEKITGIHEWAYRSSIDDSLQPYSVYVPEAYDKSKKYKLLLVLHGYSGEDTGALNMLAALKPDDFIIAAPLGRGSLAYASTGEQDVLDVKNLLLKTYNIDPGRVYLIGFSMGGYGVWRFAQFYADQFAAAASFCGCTGYACLENLRNLPMYIVHGDQDPVVPVDMDRKAAAILKDLKYDFQYEELPGVDHDAWNGWTKKVKDPAKILEYFRKYTRNPWPKTVTMAAANLRFGKQYWMKIIELENPFNQGRILGTVVNRTKIKIFTDNINVFELNLQNPGLLQKGEIIVNINDIELTVPAGISNALFKNSDEGWTISGEDRNAKAFHTGAGLADMFYGPVTIVYGTLKQQVKDKLKQAAERLADWSIPAELGQANLIGKFPVRSDTEVTEKELNERNIVLIGNPDENRIAQKIKDMLPVRFTGNGFEINDKFFDKYTLYLTYESPWNPKNLAALIHIPVNKKEAYNSMQILPIYMYSLKFNEGGPNNCAYPDVLIYDLSSEGVPLSGMFDRNWKNLSWNNK